MKQFLNDFVFSAKHWLVNNKLKRHCFPQLFKSDIIVAPTTKNWTCKIHNRHNCIIDVFNYEVLFQRFYLKNFVYTILPTVFNLIDNIEQNSLNVLCINVTFLGTINWFLVNKIKNINVNLYHTDHRQIVKKTFFNINFFFSTFY